MPFRGSLSSAAAGDDERDDDASVIDRGNHDAGTRDELTGSDLLHQAI